jgi:hypothetical protein
MKHVIKLEAIGHGHKWAGHTAARLIALFGGESEYRQQDTPWIAEITGKCPRYGMVRKFIKAHVDYSEANGKGTRGVMYYFPVNEGRLIEVFALTSWRGRDRYFAVIEDGEERRMTKEEAEQWLDASISASAS